jgi:hypothetical protein
LKAEIEISILPQYRDKKFPSFEKRLQHFEIFYQYYQISPRNQQFEYLNKLRKISFIECLKSEKAYIGVPQIIYFRTDSLVNYFSKNLRINWLNFEKYQDLFSKYGKDEINDFFLELGVNLVPKLEAVSIEVGIIKKYAAENKLPITILKERLQETGLNKESIIALEQFMSSQSLDELIKKIPDLNFDSFNLFMIKDLYKYIDTPHYLIVQPDGYILNPELWNDEWLNYDYFGAPWPTWILSDAYGKGAIGNGGFSLRSQFLTNLVCMKNKDSDRIRFHEDGHYSNAVNREPNLKYPSIEMALGFSQELVVDENIIPFGFHSKTDQPAYKHWILNEKI